jgi:hypothetical protein
MAESRPALAIRFERGDGFLDAAGEPIDVAELAEIVGRVVRAEPHGLLDVRDRLIVPAGAA